MVRLFGIGSAAHKRATSAGHSKPSSRKVVVEGPKCGTRGRDWAGRLMSCALPKGHKPANRHEGSHGGKLKTTKVYS